MSAPTHMLPGDMAWTDYSGGWRQVRITARMTGMRSQTGICYTCDPDVTRRRSHLDAAWFHIEKPELELTP